MAVDDPLIGKQLGDYTIQTLLGRGGMSRVYKGYDENLDRHAAVKVISGDFVTTTEEEYTRRFQSEARAIARLRHANIVGVYQFGRTEGIYYMAQVFLEGKDLRSLLKEYADRQQRIPPDEGLRVIRDVGGALDYAHEQGVIHRDIKPSNIMLEKKTGRAILMDFGLALSVQEGTMGDTFGSAHYIAPEQAVSSAKAVPQSDLYSLGIVLYEMFAGRVPFDDPSVMSVALKHLNELPPPPTMYNPDLPPAVEAVIMRVLDKDPKRRHATGKELIDELERAFRIDRPGEAPDVITSPAVVDMLDSKSKPPAPWWQQHVEQPPLESSRPSPSSPSAPSTPSTSSAPAKAAEKAGGLAKRFARRKEQKEVKAALDSLADDRLQLDNASLDSLLDSMPDPREIGLVGEGATGITRPERPSQMSRPSVLPGLSEPAKKQRRSWSGVWVLLIVLLTIVGGALYLGGPLGGSGDGGNGGDGGGDGGDGDQAILTGPERNQTATAAAEVSETPTRRPTAVRTRVAPVLPGDETEEPTQAPIRTPTREPSPSVEPGVEPSVEPGVEASPTAEPTEEPSETATQERTAVAEAPETRAPNLRAIYDGGEFLLINISSEMLDISGVSFEQVLSDGTVRTFSATGWNRSSIPVKPNRMTSEGCYQLLTGDADQLVPQDAVCPFFLGYFRTTVTRNHFWISDEPGATFAVRYAGIEDALGECEIAAGQCDFYAGPDAGEVEGVAPTVTPTMETGEVTEEPDIRLLYNRDIFLLVNISEEAVDISQLVFKQELSSGSERTFLAAEWDESPGLVGQTSSLQAGGCYELVSSEGTWVKPTPDQCESFLGWFRSNIVERYFWLSTRSDAVFMVQVVGDPTPLAICDISAEECTFSLPSGE